jgi:hypothetical protein
MDESREGGCQCGGLRYELTSEPMAVVVCHCRDCQKQSGSAFGLSMVVRRDAFRWSQGEPASFHTRADSGTPKECAFCPTCGSRIYNALGSMPRTFNLKPGTLDDTSWFEPSLHVWLARKQPWVAVPATARTFDANPT